MGTCASQGKFFWYRFYVFLSQTGDLLLDDKQPVRMFYECLKQGITNRNSVLNRVGKSAIRVRI